MANTVVIIRVIPLPILLLLSHVLHGHVSFLIILANLLIMHHLSIFFILDIFIFVLDLVLMFGRLWLVFLFGWLWLRRLLRFLLLGNLWNYLLLGCRWGRRRGLSLDWTGRLLRLRLGLPLLLGARRIGVLGDFWGFVIAQFADSIDVVFSELPRVLN